MIIFTGCPSVGILIPELKVVLVECTYVCFCQGIWKCSFLPRATCHEILSDFSGLSGYMDSSIKAKLMLQILRRDLVLFNQWQFSGRIIFFVTPCMCICVSRTPLLWQHNLSVWGSPSMFYSLGKLWIFSSSRL